MACCINPSPSCMGMVIPGIGSQCEAMRAVLIEEPKIDPAYPTQRWFSRGQNSVVGSSGSASVFRSACRPVADVDLSSATATTAFRASVSLTPEQCRRLAGQLLSAALDIEQNPATEAE